jgi:cbb3-type cytochrome oxidase maturation protein
METIFVLLPLALLIAAVAVGFFVWAARTGQFDDLDTPAIRILFDGEEVRRPVRPVPTSEDRRASGSEASGGFSQVTEPYDGSVIRESPPDPNSRRVSE